MASKLFLGVRCNRDQQVTEVAGVPLCLQPPQKLTILDGRVDGVAILLAHPIKPTHENRTKGCMLGLTRTAQTFWDAMFRGGLGLYAWHANVRKRKTHLYQRFVDLCRAFCNGFFRICDKAVPHGTGHRGDLMPYIAVHEQAHGPFWHRYGRSVLPVHQQVTTLKISPDKNELHRVARQVFITVRSNHIAGTISIQYKTGKINIRPDSLEMVQK